MDRIGILIIIGVLSFLAAPLIISDDAEEYTSVTVNPGEGDSIELELEVADTPEERRRGLMNRTELESDGMVFVYGREGERTFWMKNTYIPLDIIFLDSNREVVEIHEANPEPETPDEELERYTGEGAKYIIEVEQGFSAENSISRGDRFRIDY